MNDTVLAALVGAGVPMLGGLVLRAINIVGKRRALQVAGDRERRITDTEAAERLRDSLQARLERVEADLDATQERELALERERLTWEAERERLLARVAALEVEVTTLQAQVVRLEDAQRRGEHARDEHSREGEARDGEGYGLGGTQ